MLLGACFLVNYVTIDAKTNMSEGLTMICFYLMIVRTLVLDLSKAVDAHRYTVLYRPQQHGGIRGNPKLRICWPVHSLWPLR